MLLQAAEEHWYKEGAAFAFAFAFATAAVYIHTWKAYRSRKRNSLRSERLSLVSVRVGPQEKFFHACESDET